PRSYASWRDRCIDHAKVRFGKNLIKQLGDLLHQEDLSEDKRVGALRLAGHFGDSGLADAIWSCWQLDQERISRLDEYLWALAQCAGQRTEQFLTPICDAWANLSDKPEKQGSLSLRYEVGDSVSWAFWRVLPKTS